MENNNIISEAAKNIIDKFITSPNLKNEIKKYSEYETLMLSLYSIRPDVERSVVEDLEKEMWEKEYKDYFVFGVNEDNAKVRYFVDLSKYLSSDEISILQDEYDAIIDFCYEKAMVNYQINLIEMSKSECHLNSNNDTQYIPDSIIDLFLSNTHLTKDSKVYLPYMSMNSLVEKKPECHYDGFNTMGGACLLTNLYTIVKGLDSDIKKLYDLGSRYEQVKQAIEQENGEKKYDYILTMFTWLWLNSENTSILSDTLKMFAENNLADNGEMWCVLPLTFCCDNNWGSFKEYLREKGMHYTLQIFQLPKALLPYTSMHWLKHISNEICIVRLIKNEGNRLDLYDISSDLFYEKNYINGQNLDQLNVGAIQKIIESPQNEYYWCGRLDDIDFEYFNVLPSAYIYSNQQNKEGASNKKLNQLVEGANVSIVSICNEIVPKLGMHELSDNPFLCELSYEDLPKTSVSGESIRILTEDCLVIGYMGEKIKVAHVKGLDDNHYCVIGDEIFPIKIKNVDVLNEDYLRYTLVSMNPDYLSANSIGGIPVRMPYNNFMGLSINILSLHEQDRIIKEVAIKSLSVANQKLKDSYDSYRRETHMKRHTIGNKIKQLGGWLKNIELARKQGNGVVCDNDLIGSRKIEVSNIYENIKKAFQALQMQISYFDRGFGMVKTKIDLNDYIKNFILQYENSQFRYDFKNIVDSKYEIMFPLKALDYILENIVNNACSHGFKNRLEGFDNIIKIRILIVEDHYKLLIANNGESINNMFIMNNIFEWGVSSKSGEMYNRKEHFGIGVYEIKKLMNEFGGDVRIVNNPENEFSVTYELEFY